VSGLIFPLLAILLSAGGSVLLWLRHRDPTSLDHGVDEFKQEMQALAPEPGRRPGSRP
jgi:hypothetical protein